MKYENENTEYKSKLTEDIYKEVIAFANTDGGIIYIGIDDNGNTVGLDNIDETYTRITNGIRDAIQPDITMFIKYTLQDNQIIRIKVSEGAFKPYYLKSKGIKPTGVYVRQGSSSVPASSERIRQMIKLSDGDIFENMRCLEQNLTFKEAAEAFSRYGIEFSEDKFSILGIKNLDDQLFTNLAFILSDQCKHTTKVAVFDDTNNTIFKDAKEFKGSIFKQLDDTFNYLMLCNKTAAEFDGLYRVDKPDYPAEAIREALLNALIHRDYSFSGSIIINVNDECMEFISLGGLISGLSDSDIKSGISQPRNRNLAEIFHRLKLIESYGTGIRRIYNLYKNFSIQPRIELTPNTFKLILPNMNKLSESIAQDIIIKEVSSGYAQTVTTQMQTVLNFLSKQGSMTDTDFENLLGIKRTRVYILAKQMCEMGLIEKHGRGSNKSYTLKG